MRITTSAKRYFNGFAAKQTSEIATLNSVVNVVSLHLLEVLEEWMFRWNGATSPKRLAHAVCARPMTQCHQMHCPSPMGSEPSSWSSHSPVRSSGRQRGGISRFR